MKHAIAHSNPLKFPKNLKPNFNLQGSRGFPGFSSPLSLPSRSARRLGSNPLLRGLWRDFGYEIRSNHSPKTFTRFADNFPASSHNQFMQSASTIPGTRASAQNSPP